MTGRRTLWTVTTCCAAALAVAAWQFADYRAHCAHRLAEHREHGRALLDAAEAVVIRECRGGRAHPDDLSAALGETRQAFDLDWLALRSTDGSAIASVGEHPGPAAAAHLFAKPFETLLPRPAGRGPFRPGGGGSLDLPALMVLELATAPAPLLRRLDEAKAHAIVSAGAMISALALAATLLVLRTRAAELQADLARSEARLEGLETLRRLGAGLAHETRNPLGAIRGFAERLAAGRLDGPDVARTARAIVEETDRTVARLEEFLLLSRPAALRRTRVRVRDLFAELRALLESDLDSAGASLEIDCADAEIDADRDQLRRLLLNLLLNAVQAARPGGRVVLRCAADDGRPRRLVVEDDGPGVPAEIRPTLFEPYVTGRSGGTGLGLAIAQRIASDHGFDLRYEPVEPQGTRMVLELGGR